MVELGLLAETMAMNRCHSHEALSSRRFTVIPMKHCHPHDLLSSRRKSGSRTQSNSISSTPASFLATISSPSASASGTGFMQGLSPLRFGWIFHSRLLSPQPHASPTPVPAVLAFCRGCRPYGSAGFFIHDCFFPNHTPHLPHLRLLLHGRVGSPYGDNALMFRGPSPVFLASLMGVSFYKTLPEVINPEQQKE